MRIREMRLAIHDGDGSRVGFRLCGQLRDHRVKLAQIFVITRLAKGIDHDRMNLAGLGSRGSLPTSWRYWRFFAHSAFFDGESLRENYPSAKLKNAAHFFWKDRVQASRFKMMETFGLNFPATTQNRASLLLKPFGHGWTQDTVATSE